MAKGNFKNCFNVSMRWEKGTVNNPHDPGHLTKDGVTQVRYDQYRVSNHFKKQSVLNITEQEEESIYHTYWEEVHGEFLPLGIDLCCFDFAINSGAAEARSIYASVLATAHPEDTADIIIMSICLARLSYLRRLHTWEFFGDGWRNRVNNIQYHALAMIKPVVHPEYPLALVSPVHEGCRAPLAMTQRNTSMFNLILEYVLARLREKSTVAGLVASFFSMIHFVAPAALTDNVTMAVIAIAGIVAALIPAP